MARKKRNSTRRTRSPLFKIGFISSLFSFIIRLLQVILAVSVIGLIFKTALSFILTSDYFKVRHIRIIGERAEATLSAGVSHSLKKGVNIFDIDLRRYKADIGYNYPQLKDIRVNRILPDTLKISYTVRKPFCQVDAGIFYLVSDDAVVLPNPLSAPMPELTIITGVRLPERYSSNTKSSISKSLIKAVSLLKEISDSSFSDIHRIFKIDMYDPENPALFLENGTMIEIGDSPFEEKCKVLEEVLNDLKTKGKQAKVIDLRFKDVVVVPR